MEKIYYDCEEKRELPKEGIAPAGKGFDPFIMTCEENGFTALQRKRGIYLIFEGNLPKLEFYPVPRLVLFAHDGENGYFAHGGKGLDSPIYFITKELNCWYLAESFYAFVQMVVFEPNWKESITGKKTEQNETEEERLALGMQFGFSEKTENLSEKIHRETAFEIFENIEKAREKVSLI